MIIFDELLDFAFSKFSNCCEIMCLYKKYNKVCDNCVKQYVTN